MAGNFSSNAVVAKARSIFGDCLKREDFLQLTTKSSVSDVCAFLKQTKRFSGCLASANEQSVHRGQLENLLRRNTFMIYERFCRFDHTESKAFFDIIIMKMEIEQLLTALMYINAKSTDEYINALPSYLMERCSFDLMALAKADTFTEVEQVIKDTPYYKLLHNIIAATSGSSSGRIQINACEQALYTYYFEQSIKKAGKRFSGKARKDIEKMLLISADMMNAITCFRRKVYFNDSAEQIKAALIPYHNRLKGEALDRVLACGSADEVQEALKKIGYGTALERGLYENVDLFTEKVSFDSFRHRISFSGEAPVVYFALIEYLSVELKNVITIIEGIRYQMPPTEIQRMLVF